MRIGILVGPLLTAWCCYALGFFCAKWASSRAAKRVLLAAAALAALPWLLASAYYAHVLDTPVYYEWRSLPATDLSIGLIGFPLGARVGVLFAHAKGLVRGRVGAFVGGPLFAAALLLLAFTKPVFGAMPDAQVHDRWEGDVCLQSTPATCGPCASATVLRALGSSVGESDLARESASTRSGTLNWLLARALRRWGFAVTFGAPSSLEEVVPPAVLGVQFRDGAGHFVAFLERRGSVVVIGDPLEGLLELTRAAFDERFRFDRFAMEIRAKP